MLTIEEQQQAEAIAIATEVEAEFGFARYVPLAERPISYLDLKPKPIKVQISLVEYFERIKRLKADKWQIHFCEYLQKSVEERHIKPTWAEFHAQAQLGKTVVLSQVFPAWCIGHDPLWRVTLAMYNVRRSQAHSGVVIQILQSNIHQDIFRDKAGHIAKNVSKEGWKTNARVQVNDGQETFNPVGLQSGMTGSGFDYLILDDPYKEPRDAFSETVFDNLDRFWQYGVVPRLSSYSCIAAMFHRYAYDDFGGYLLNTGKFDYVRYSSIADGAYVHDETGQRFEDPLGRQTGELISPDRFPQSYYDDKKLDQKVWLSMFQGRPSSEEGDFFKVNMIGEASDAEWETCTLRARGWDHAATQGAGDRSAGGLLGMLPDGTTIVADVFSEQLDTGSRVAKQRELAEKDGASTAVVVPEEVAAAGKDVVFLMRQELRGFTVVPRKVTNAAPGSNAKQRRAYNFSVAVNSGKVKFLNRDWNTRIKRLLRNFGATASGDDEIDALSDAYNHLYEESKRGLVVNFRDANLRLADGKKIPRDWTVYAALKISPESNTPNSGVIIARAALNTGMSEALFILDEFKEYSDRYENAFRWIDASLKRHCDQPEAAIIWLHKNSLDYLPTIHQKLPKYSVAVFDETPTAGITETNWYLQNKRLFAQVSDPMQMAVPINSLGLISLRQEAATWGFTDKGLPSGVGQVWDCVRMIAYRFRTYATELTVEEMVEQAMPAEYRISEMLKKTGKKHLTDTQEIARSLMEEEVRERMNLPREDPEWLDRGRRYDGGYNDTEFEPY
jgi:phage terminase large subunit-like protein